MILLLILVYVELIDKHPPALGDLLERHTKLSAVNTAPLTTMGVATRNKKKSDLQRKGKTNEAKKLNIRQAITNRVGGDRFGYSLLTDLHWPDTIGSGHEPLHGRMRGGSESAAVRLRPLRSTPPGSFTVLPGRAGGIPALHSQLPIA